MALKAWWWNSATGPHSLSMDPLNTVKHLRAKFRASEPEILRYLSAARAHAQTHTWREGPYIYSFCHFYQNALQAVVNVLQARAPAPDQVRAVRDIYAQYNPEKLLDTDFVERLLRKAHGKEEELMARLKQKYMEQKEVAVVDKVGAEPLRGTVANGLVEAHRPIKDEPAGELNPATDLLAEPSEEAQVETSSSCGFVSVGHGMNNGTNDGSVRRFA